MAQNSAASPAQFALTSYDTALCLIPPRHLWTSLDGVRSCYDRGFGVWPPHVNLIYPFVRPELLADVATRLDHLDLGLAQPLHVHLDQVNAFAHKQHNTVFICPTRGHNTDIIGHVRQKISAALQTQSGRDWEDTVFQPHLTVGQSEDIRSDSHKFLLEKARLLTPIEWSTSQIAILSRDTNITSGDLGRRMRIWGYLDIASHETVQHPEALDPYGSSSFGPAIETFLSGKIAKSQTSYHFDRLSSLWEPLPPKTVLDTSQTVPESLVVASYNVLAEFQWPPSDCRYSDLLANILCKRASADILVMQEVTDHFLPFLLANDEIRSRYPFATHGPPSQKGIGPLPSLLNVVVLSKYQVQWEYLASQRKHKACAIITLPNVGIRDEKQIFFPWIVAAVHLSQGLVDGAVVAKKNEVQKIVDYLSTHFAEHPWIMAGDFNLTTSSYTINAARRRKAISSQSLQYLRLIDHSLAATGLQDAWLSTRVESGESSDITAQQSNLSDVFEGEQGATFNPLTNTLASNLVGSGLNNRPQRYDRILVKTNGFFLTKGFNMFGKTPCHKDGLVMPAHASDHWGIRCLLVRRLLHHTEQTCKTTPVQLQRAQPQLNDIEALKQHLRLATYMPTNADQASREAALAILQHVLLDAQGSEINERSQPGLSITIVPVGSFGLGVWTASSDVDCLCIGNISPKTFFNLARQRLSKASSEGIRILRRVKASSGQMLELDIRGLKFDLQYCPATSIIERWPEVMKKPPDDPVFDLPIQTLLKLKPARDLYYLRRSIPDMAQYRLAHILIKVWAKSRGIYSSKFGLLGGIHISTLLVPICKALALQTSQVSTGDLIRSFFHHYANFDWKNNVVFDPFFHRDLRYNRSSREALCLLGWHSPTLNTALTASTPTVHTIRVEMSKANSLLQESTTTWETFLGSASNGDAQSFGATNFLHKFKTYIKIDAYYWGSSAEKGRKFIGWLESRCVMLLVDIDKKNIGLMARIWPERFTDSPPVASQDVGSECRSSFLIGLEWNYEQSATGLAKEQSQSTQSALTAILNDFEVRIRGDEKYYDPTTSWMAAAIAHASDVQDLHLDDGDWEPLANDSDDDDSDDELIPEDEIIGSGNRAVVAAANPIAKPSGLGKFRTAIDVMNRLRWDGNLDSSDFIVGYEDRFVGACEKALEQWKSEQTDEEFIPQHRILYFKRKSDNFVVWERRTWTDEIFGSGVRIDRSAGDCV